VHSRPTYHDRYFGFAVLPEDSGGALSAGVAGVLFTDVDEAFLFGSAAVELVLLSDPPPAPGESGAATPAPGGTVPLVPTALPAAGSAPLAPALELIEVVPPGLIPELSILFTVFTVVTSVVLLLFRLESVVIEVVFVVVVTSPGTASLLPAGELGPDTAPVVPFIDVETPGTTTGTTDGDDNVDGFWTAPANGGLLMPPEGELESASISVAGELSSPSSVTVIDPVLFTRTVFKGLF
jgi:hypothetical protein